MSAANSRGNLYVEPLFYDALSGRFYPPSDPKGLAHTLGRLMIATHQKGERDNPTDAEKALVNNYGHLYVYRYRPSWAPAVMTSVLYREDDARRTHKFASGIILSADPGGSPNDLSVVQHAVDNHVAISGEDESPVVPALGPTLNHLQSHIAERAQAFFAQAHNSTKCSL